MEEKKEIFADGIGQIHFAGGMVRYDFVTLQPEEDGKAPVPRANVREHHPLPHHQVEGNRRKDPF